MTAPQMQRSLPEILENIASNLTTMVHAEFRLAKTELKEGAEKVAGPGAAVGAGVALAFYGLGFLLLAAVYALSLVMAGWLAALIVGGVLAVAAGILIGAGGMKLRRVNLTPDKTISNVGGGCAMGETTNQIEWEIAQKRHELSDNLIELKRKAKSAVGWRSQVEGRPGTMLAVAFGGGIILSAQFSALRGPAKSYAEPPSRNGVGYDRAAFRAATQSPSWLAGAAQRI